MASFWDASAMASTGTPSELRVSTPAPARAATAGAKEEGARPKSTVRTRDFSSGLRVTTRVRKTEVPAADHVGRTVEHHETNRILVRKTTVDGPVQPNGTFTRTVRTTSVKRTPDAHVQDPHAPAPWARKPGDFAPKWKQRDIESLYSSKTLGAVYHDPADTKVRLFAPNAKRVELVLESGERFRAAPDRSGVWEASTGKAPTSLYGKAYHMEVDGKKVTDPYAHATSGDYGPAKFVNLKAYRWRTPKDVQLPGDHEVISEVHVRDMTASPTSPVPNKLRGSYAGMGSKAVVDHYKDLGIGAVQPLPLHQYDHASGDRGTMNHWGYMTTQFFAPTRRYALNQDHTPEELMGMVDAYKQKGIKVVMDVVYNHTAAGPEIAFNVLGRSYYYRFKGDQLANGAGTGNEFKSENPMARKLIIDSVMHFVDNYRVDGFRFDLGSLLDVTTMRAIDRRLPKNVFLTSEPWAAEWDRARWSKGDLQGSLKGTRWTVWNDGYRDAVKGFMTGNLSEEGRNRVMTAVAGSNAPYDFAVHPRQSVNYIESHDEHTVADMVKGDKNRALLGGVLLLTSQGTPMLGHGQEFMRTKKGIANAHNMDDDVSHIDWSLKQKNADVFNVYKTLIALRKDQPQFKLSEDRRQDIHWIMPDHDDKKSAVGYRLPAPAPKPGEARASDVVVFANSGHQDAWFKLPKGNWQIVVDGAHVGKDVEGQTTANGHYRMRPGSAAVLKQVPEAAAAASVAPAKKPVAAKTAR